MSTTLPSTCQLNCQNGGYCNFVSSNQQTLQKIFTSGGLIQECICPPGYTGIACENIVEECQLPKLTCHNGVPCSLNLQGEWDGHYVCDCSVADALSKFAGNMCRSPATTYCGSGEFTNRSFCTNGGLCWENLVDGIGNGFDTHEGCKCPPEFEGEHCEYVKGMAPMKFDRISVAEIVQPMVNKVSSSTMAEYTSGTHVKNSKEMTANDEDGTWPIAPAVVDDPANVIAMAPPAVVKTEPSKPTHSKNSVTGSIPTKPIANTPKTSSFSPPVTAVSSKSTDPGSIIGLIISVMGITLFGTALFMRSRRQRKLRSGISDQPSQVLASLDRNNYTDETPIRVRIMAEDEKNELELDEVLGDDDDVVSIGECSLEEIELEDGQNGTYRDYLRNIDEEFEESDVSENGGGQFPSIFA